MGIGDSFGSAFAKAEIAAGTVLPLAGTAFISVRPEDRDGATAAARRLAGLGFRARLRIVAFITDPRVVDRTLARATLHPPSSTPATRSRPAPRPMPFTIPLARR